MATIDELLADIQRTAAAYGAEAKRMAAEDAEQGGWGQTDTVSVAVGPTGRLVGVETSDPDAGPTRWRAQFATAYEEALGSRTMTPAAALVPGVAAGPSQPSEPVSPDAEASRLADEEWIEAWGAATESLETIAETATVGGATVTVNGMLLVAEVSVTPASLTTGTADAAVMAAYAQAAETVQTRLLTEVTR